MQPLAIKKIFKEYPGCFSIVEEINYKNDRHNLQINESDGVYDDCLVYKFDFKTQEITLPMLCREFPTDHPEIMKDFEEIKEYILKGCKNEVV